MSRTTNRAVRAFVYYNLRRKTFSIKALNGASKGKVIAHADVVEVFDAELRVSEAGRQRVIREKRKNVHAGIVGLLGYYGSNTQPHGQGAVRIAYNPYMIAHFVSPDGFPVRFADRVILGTFGSYAEGAKVCDCGGFMQAGAFVHRSSCERSS